MSRKQLYFTLRNEGEMISNEITGWLMGTGEFDSEEEMFNSIISRFNKMTLAITAELTKKS